MKKIKKTVNFINASLDLTIGGVKCELKLSVPEDKTSANTLLPFAREVTNKAVEIAVEEFTKDGKKISCKKGCGACCVQLVPISDTEIREIAQLIKSYPQEKKKSLMFKFNTAKSQLNDAGLWETLSHPENISDDEIRALGHQYFAQQIPCPFLEEGACSIHPVRPLSCREFLVTSPAIHCSNPDENSTVTVDIPIRISNAFATLGKNDSHFTHHWVPLILAPYWQKLHPNQTSKKTGPRWVEEFLNNINPKN